MSSGREAGKTSVFEVLYAGLTLTDHLISHEVDFERLCMGPESASYESVSTTLCLFSKLRTSFRAIPGRSFFSLGGTKG